MVEASKGEALEAVAHYNRPLSDRGFEGFFMHMHIAWLYLLQAEFKKADIDFRYKKSDGRLERVDGEPRCWELAKCTRERWSDPNNAVRANLDVTVAIRNKVEHRWTEGLSLMVAGRAQALVTNYHTELTSHFGDIHSLGVSLRFPVYVGVMSKDGAVRLAAEQARVGKGVRRLISEFEAKLDEATLEDTRYEMRVHLIERTGPKTDADMAIEFVRAADLTQATREELRRQGRDGSVVVRDVVRPVILPDWVKPGVAKDNIAARLPFVFNASHFTKAWKKLRVRPPTGDPKPMITKSQYCAYDEPHKDYVYSPAYIDKLVTLLDTEKKWSNFFGKSPERKISKLRSVGPKSA